MTQLSADLLKILVCPKCKAPVAERNGSLVCSGRDCRLSYPIRDGIPIMLTGEAAPPGDSIRSHPAG